MKSPASQSPCLAVSIEVPTCKHSITMHAVCMHRLGVSAVGDRIPGHLHVPAPQPQALPPCHAHSMGGGVGLSLAPLQDHAGCCKSRTTRSKRKKLIVPLHSATTPMYAAI